MLTHLRPLKTSEPRSCQPPCPLPGAHEPRAPEEIHQEVEPPIRDSSFGIRPGICEGTCTSLPRPLLECKLCCSHRNSSKHAEDCGVFNFPKLVDSHSFWVVPEFSGKGTARIQKVDPRKSSVIYTLGYHRSMGVESRIRGSTLWLLPGVWV